MIAGVITIPERKLALNRLLDVVSPEVDEVKIFCDENHQGHWWNYWRMFASMLPQAAIGEPILLMADDAITVPGFRNQWEYIHEEAQDSMYVLFSRQRHLFKADNMGRGYVTKVQSRGLYDLASIFVDQQSLPNDVREWFRSIGRYLIPPKRQNHLDVVIQEYFVYHGIPWTITIPTLFDHQTVKSSLGHATIGGSPVYVGHENIQ